MKSKKRGQGNKSSLVSCSTDFSIAWYTASPLGDASTISGPRKLRSYYTVVAYTDKKKFSFSEGAIVQVLQKDTSGECSVFRTNECSKEHTPGI